MPVYARAPAQFVRGEGAWLYDENDTAHLDFASGIGVVALGHCHPHLVETLQHQAATLWHTSNLFPIPEQERLATRLAAATFADVAFFTNSGAEAWECGLKVVRRHVFKTGQPQRTRVITFEGGFHGRTLAGVSSTKQHKLTEGLDPLLEGFDVVPFADVEAVRRAITDKTAAIHIEPVQGEGGIRVCPPAVLQALRALADSHGLLLYFDEIQCGMGRSGHLLACEHAGVVPDVVCLAKGIGGGFPLGACLATHHAAQGMTPGTHGSTYGGNPLACAVGNAVLDVMLADGFFDTVTAMGQYLRERLQGLAARHPVIRDVRGLGLMLGLKLADGIAVRDVCLTLLDRGLITVPAAGNVIRLLPPLIVTEAECDKALTLLETTLKDI